MGGAILEGRSSHAIAIGERPSSLPVSTTSWSSNQADLLLHTEQREQKESRDGVERDDGGSAAGAGHADVLQRPPQAPLHAPYVQTLIVSVNSLLSNPWIPAPVRCWVEGFSGYLVPSCFEAQIRGSMRSRWGSGRCSWPSWWNGTLSSSRISTRCSTRPRLPMSAATSVSFRPLFA